MRGAVPFEADGESLFLRLTTNAQVRYQDAAGESFVAAPGRLQASSDDLGTVRRIFWAGLSHMDGMTLERAGDIMDAVGPAEAGRVIREAISGAFPAPSAEGNGRKGEGGGDLLTVLRDARLAAGRDYAAHPKTGQDVRVHRRAPPPALAVAPERLPDRLERLGHRFLQRRVAPSGLRPWRLPQPFPLRDGVPPVRELARPAVPRLAGLRDGQVGPSPISRRRPPKVKQAQKPPASPLSSIRPPPSIRRSGPAALMAAAVSLWRRRPPNLSSNARGGLPARGVGARRKEPISHRSIDGIRGSMQRGGTGVARVRSAPSWPLPRQRRTLDRPPPPPLAPKDARPARFGARGPVCGPKRVAAAPPGRLSPSLTAPVNGRQGRAQACPRLRGKRPSSGSSACRRAMTARRWS